VQKISLDHIYADYGNVVRNLLTMEERPPDMRVKVKFSRYRAGVAQRVGKGIPLLFHDRGTRTG